ncbi:MAG: hypothetical protein C0602_05390 [Denitrovibrio sp.]|nr:MAG: hypothetical protein C0602_05390 [Denitrovibrio sp.]
MKRGFTLVELAIVLIIIGIILSSALKATEIIKDAKAKKNITQITKLADAQHQFFERTGRYAGDSDNDGKINNATINSNSEPNDTNTTTVTDPDYAFEELINMGILSEQNNANLASLTVGGPAYFAGYEYTDTGSGNIYVYNILVIRQVPCLTAFQMEISLDKNQPDDANSAGTGRVRNINGTAIRTADAWTLSTICANDVEKKTDIAYLFDRF